MKKPDPTRDSAFTPVRYRGNSRRSADYASRKAVYRLLEEKMLGYADYVSMAVEPLAEPLVPIPESRRLTARQIGADMQPYTGDQIFVRRGVLRRLERAAKQLPCADGSLRLEVVYGYRALEIQQQLFEKYKATLQSQYDDEDDDAGLLAATHRLIAVPEVAGHPTGGAVDIQIIRSGKPVDFGTSIWEFALDSFAFSPFVSKEAWENRQLLRQVMMAAGFAPFDGEWWHFSYGDKEWARYYDEPAAVYEQMNFSISSIKAAE